MKYNGTDNIITDNDILVTSSAGSNKDLHTVIEEQQYDIDELKSNVKWIYKYGGVGGVGGSGSGSVSAGKWSADVYINDVPVTNGSITDLSKKLINDIAPITVKVSIKNPSAGGYKFKLEYGYDDGSFQTYPQSLTTDNNCSVEFNLKISKNSQLVIKVTDIDNNYKQTIYKYYIYGLDYKIIPMTYNSQGVLYELKDFDYKPSQFPNGVVYRLSINNFAGSIINYNIVSTIDCKIIQINEQNYKLYNTDKNNGSYYDNENLKGYLQSNDTIITLDYLITQDTLKNELNFGSQTFMAYIESISNGISNKNEVKSEYSIVPDSNQYVICLSESIMGKVYDDNTNISIVEAQKKGNAFNVGDSVSFKLRPFNFSSDTITINYTLINTENDINTSSTINLKAGRYISQSFKVYSGWNKLIINTNIVKYYYGVKISASVNWYNQNGENNSKAKNLDLSYVRFYNSISDNMKNETNFKQIYVNNYLELNTNINAQDKVINLYNNKTINTATKVDTHFAFSIQFSGANNTDDTIFELKNEKKDILFSVTQSSIKCNQFTSNNDIKIYIPKENNYTPSDATKYHLVDIYIKKTDPYTLTKTVNNTNSVDMQYYLNDLADDIDVSNSKKEPQYYIEVYIDGITDGVTKYFVSTYPNICYLCLKNINVSYNLFELGKFNNESLKFNDIDADLYYYTYKYILTKGSGVTKNNIDLIYNLSSLDYSASISPDLTQQLILRKHNQICISKEYLDQLKKMLDVPIYIINVAHTRENDNITSIFQWLNGTYQENDNITAWPVQTISVQGKHKTGITYVAPDDTVGIEVEFPDDDAYTQALFNINIQGSSTRQNHGKNLDLILVNKDTDTHNKLLYSPNFDENDSNTYLPESKFTLKADIVDSAHSNNTVMGKFINQNTQKFDTASNGQYKSYIKNCLEGFPCIIILNVDYEVSGSSSEYYFMGLYNFNLGRGSYSNLGYVNNSIFDKQLSSVTALKPFEFFKTTTDEYELRTDFGCAEITGNNHKFDFSQWDDTILYPFENENGNTYMWDDIVTSQEGAFKIALKYFVRDIAISGGYIFDYLGKEAIDHKKWDADGGWNHIGGVPDVSKQYKRTSDDTTVSYYDPTIKVPEKSKWQTIFQRTMQDGFEYNGDISYSRLDYTSAVEYYTICMAFGLVDSVQKNLNVRTWTLNKTNRKETDPEEKDLTRSKFYISFYDMDTCLGIDNNSNDTTTFCFSDYWESTDTEQNGVHIISSINQYRDYFSEKYTITDASTGIKSGEIGYDIPSSFLFGVAKYGTEVFNTDELLKLDYLEYPTPTLLWIRYRAGNTTAYDKPGTGSLQNAQYFMDTYYKKHMEGVSELVFNLNYKVKYLAYNIQEKWEFDSTKKNTFIGTYTINNKINYSSGFHNDIQKFRGRSIYRVYDWLNSRLHILDAYFNLQDSRELLSVSEIEKQHQTNKNTTNTELVQLRLSGNNLDDSVKTIVSLLNTSNDINIKSQIFKSSTTDNPKINFPSNPITLQVKAQNYSPIMFDVGGTIQGKYLLRSSANMYQITFSGSGNIAFALYGSNQITYLSNVTWYTPTSMIIESSNLTNIYGNNPTYNVSVNKLMSPALQKIELMGYNYTGSLELSDISTYSNLNLINISNTGINLKATDINVSTINVSGVSATKCEISRCNKLSSLKLSELKVTDEFLLTVNYSSNVLFNEIEVKRFSVSCSVVNQNNTIVIDGSRGKFQTLEELTISGFAKVQIYSCPKLQKVTISEITSGDDAKDIYLKELAIINCCTDKLCTEFNVLSSTSSSQDKTLDLYSFKKLSRICFYGTQNFEQAILPETLNLQGSEFGNCKSLKYVDIKTSIGTKASKITINGYDKYVLSSSAKSTSGLTFITYTAPNVGCFYNCYEFKMERTVNDSSVVPIRVSNSVKSLEYLFGLDSHNSNINLAKISNFIDNISISNSITSINYMCMNQDGIKLSKEQFVADGPDKATLHLGTFGKLSSGNLVDAFYINTIYINKWIWYDKDKKQIISCNNINRLFGQDSKNLYMTIDCLYPILNKIQYLIGITTWQTIIYPIYSGSSQKFDVYTILTDEKKTETSWKDKTTYTKSYTFNGTIGNLITNQVVPARAIFVNETGASHTVDSQDNTGAIYPTAMTRFSGISFCASNVQWDLYGLFSKKWKLQYIDFFQTFGFSTVTEYEDLFNAKFMPSTLIDIKHSLNTSFNTSVDYTRFLDFNTLITNYNNSVPSNAMFNYENGDSLNYATGLTFTKHISSDTFKEWMVYIFKANNAQGITNLFRNCNILVSQAEANNKCDFSIETIFSDYGENLVINQKIHNIYCLFYNLHCYIKDKYDITKTSQSAEVQYMTFGTDMFKYLPNITTVSSAFTNNYWNDPIPFNVFNKRYKCDDTYYYLEFFEGTDILVTDENKGLNEYKDKKKIRKKIKYVSYSYKQVMNQVNSCFANIHFNPAYISNRYTEGSDIIKEAGINYYQFINDDNTVINDDEKIYISEKIKVLLRSTGNNSDYIYPSYEYYDTLNLHGAFYEGNFEKAGTSTGVTNVTSSIQKAPLTKSVSEYLESLIVAPDLLYGCQSSASIQGIVSQYGVSKDMLTGILPAHFYKQMKTLVGGTYEVFTGCLVIPNYVGTYVNYDSNGTLKLRYNIYTFIPEEFVNSDMNNLQNMFRFYIHWPKQGQTESGVQTYDFYVLSTSNSFGSNITSLNNAFPVSSVVSYQSYGTISINYQTANRSIHYNLQCTYQTQSYEASKKSEIFGTLNYDNLRYISVFDTGLNMEIYKSLNVTNLITSINLLYGYYGYIFNSSYDTRNIILTTNSENKKYYCINVSANYQWQSNQLSCNIIFPICSNTSETTRRLLYFYDIPQNAKFNTNISMFSTSENREYYKNMFDSMFTFNDNEKYSYATYE